MKLKIKFNCTLIAALLLLAANLSYSQIPLTPTKPVLPKRINKKFEINRFERGDISFRIVPDTLGATPLYHLQKKDGNKWKEIRSYPWTAYGYDEDKDYNADGAKDLVWHWEWQDEVYLYNPAIQDFVLLGICGKNPRRLQDLSPQQGVAQVPEWVWYAYWRKDKFDGFTSELFKIEDFKKTTYAVLDAETDHGLGDLMTVVAKKVENGDVKNAMVVENIDPATLEEAKDYYIGYERFVKDYWAKNWQKFLH